MVAFTFAPKQLLSHKPFEVVLYALSPCSMRLFVLTLGGSRLMRATADISITVSDLALGVLRSLHSVPVTVCVIPSESILNGMFLWEGYIN